MYSLCRDTVTIFRGEEEIVLDGCCLQEKQVQRKDVCGTWGEREFLLIVPGDRPIYPGDKVLLGESRVTIAAVTPYFVDGRIYHREGRGA